MNRSEMLQRLAERRRPWDMVVIGGGATGIGIAIDAAARGYDVALLEQSDFGKGTSSRSTKLVHGGVRYLQQGNVSLVMQALEERGILLRNAPHLVHDLAFIVPNYDWWEAPFYGIGMKVYELLAGKYGFGRSRHLSKQQTIEHLPTIKTEGLRGGILYHDGQFDDSRLLINMVRTAVNQGAALANYAPVLQLTKGDDGFLDGVVARDLETDQELILPAKTVINATGPFTDQVRQLDTPGEASMIAPSQGVHVVLDRSFLPGNAAIMVPHTRDGRVLFAIPWQGRTLVGTTDTPIPEVSLEPLPQPEEIAFILETAAGYLAKAPTSRDVLSVFAGIRPLVGAGDSRQTAVLSRDHAIHISDSGLITMTGGKWTTYRHMAEDCVNHAATLADLPARPCATRELNIHGFHPQSDKFGQLSQYGADAPAMEDLLRTRETYQQALDPRLPVRAGEVVWAARHEMARTVDDVLARRTRALLLDARAALDVAPTVAQLLATELGHDDAWQQRQVEEFRRIALRYLPEP